MADSKRVLLIEDEAACRDGIMEALAGSYEVLTASTGAEAMDVLSSESGTVSLILLDLSLPDTDGTGLLQTFREDVSFRRIPVIVMTADVDAEAECLGIGAADCIPKPFPRREVIAARVRRTIELSDDRDLLRWTERDQLTGLYNRDFFYRYAALLDRRSKDRPMDAIILNVNHFHTLNDRFGRAYCDGVLKRIAETVRTVASDAGGLAGRGEADAFLLYCPHGLDYQAVLDAVSASAEKDEGEESRPVRLRMGVYPEADRSIDVERRFARAKMASDDVRGNYAAPIGFYDRAMHEAEIRAEQLIDGFADAIRERQFVVYYQPKFDIRPEEPALCSAEALVRWRHPEFGLVSPGVFMPIFEKNGLIQELDHYVWRETAEQIREWKNRLGVSVPVSINVSRMDLYDPDITSRLVELVRVNRLECEELILEVTESAYTDNPGPIIERVRHLRRLGFRIEMDDFGSGYSSLSMLATMPVDAMKLDQTFIQNAFRERKDTRLLEVMIEMAGLFGIPTIAEGVETAEQVLTLKTMGCDVIQGFYFSRPVPPEDFERFLLGKRAPSVLKASQPRISRRDLFTYGALHDPVTGLYNYSAFDILFHDCDLKHVAVVIAAIDDYEEMLAEKGREYADAAACRVANALKSAFRSVDYVCRLSGSEFVVIATRVTNIGKEQIFAKVESVNRSLLTEGDGTGPVSMSVGIAFSDRDRPDGDVFQDADTALQRMREVRRTGYAVF
ncbi:MAG: EAL domain-containing protein [Clostridia bacterium]|nr:EAL domain-containing protein [Clostridia bacterium]